MEMEKKIRFACLAFFRYKDVVNQGGVAQRLEQSDHNRKVVGSNPTPATFVSFLFLFCDIIRWMKVEKQQEARLLRKQGKSINEIARVLGVARSSVSKWVRTVRLTKKQQTKLKTRELEGAALGRQVSALHWHDYRKLNPKPQPNLLLLENRKRTGSFFDSWNEKSAYVLGYFAADGCMYHSRNGGFYDGGYYIQFDSIDEELISLVKNLMGIYNKTESKVLWRNDYMSKRKPQYKLRFTSKRAFQKLLNLGFTPHKSLTLKFPAVPKKYLSDFVRGYFDGDGCVYFGKIRRKDNKKIRYVLIARFTCGSRKFLEKLQQELTSVAGVGLGSLHVHGSVWDLSYSTKDARQLYNFLYPTDIVPCLKRKKDKFVEALTILRSRGLLVRLVPVTDVKRVRFSSGPH